jgi:hypothetical protein
MASSVGQSMMFPFSRPDTNPPKPSVPSGSPIEKGGAGILAKLFSRERRGLPREPDVPKKIISGFNPPHSAAPKPAGAPTPSAQDANGFVQKKEGPGGAIHVVHRPTQL